MLPDILRNHLQYSAWASGLLLEAAAELTEEELIRDFHTADHSVLGTLVHIFGADRIWLARIQHSPNPVGLTDEDFSLTVLQKDWPIISDHWIEWADGITEESAMATLTYKDLRGNEWTQPLWQIVLHVVNHATHHRGQVAGFLRTMGKTPPKLDLAHFDRLVKKT